MSGELVHNKTYAHRLPPTFIEQARGWADFRENAIFSDSHMSGIGNSKHHLSHACKYIGVNKNLQSLAARR